MFYTDSDTATSALMLMLLHVGSIVVTFLRGDDFYMLCGEVKRERVEMVEDDGNANPTVTQVNQVVPLALP